MGLVALTAAGVMSLVLAGCGGSHKQQPTASATTSAQPTATSTQSSAAPAGAALRLGKQAYQKKMRVLGNQLGKSIEGLYPLSSGSKGSDVAKQTVVKLQKSEAVVSGVLAQLQRIVPPVRVAKQHRLLRSGVRLLSSQLTEMIADVKSGNVSDFISKSNFTMSLQEINAAANAMTDSGYNIIGKDAAINP